jgi:predicted DNA-binding ribbon-helix-helix protein
MKSTVVKRSIVVAGHKMSVSLEDEFWNRLDEIVRERHMTLSELVAEIDAQRQLGNLSSALRFFVLEFYRTQLSETQILLEWIIFGNALDFVEMTDDQRIEALEQALRECAEVALDRIEVLKELLGECTEVLIARGGHGELVARIRHLLDENPSASIMEDRIMRSPCAD